MDDPEILEPAATFDSIQSFISLLRSSIKTAIIENVPHSNAASVIVTLMTGDRAGLDPNLKQAFIHSGLIHLLSISGLHVGLIGGITFFFIRGVLAAFPFLALRYPIKKWAALSSIGMIVFYMLIADARIPTIRATVMVGLMMIAIMVDRHPLSIRLILFAATIILVFIPESVLDPSFHLSFFTVLGLSVLTREFGGPIRRWQSDKSLFVKGLSYCLGIAMVSGIATLVSLPFTAFHFQIVTVVGVITNMLAIPLMTFVIMPFIVLIYMTFPLTMESHLLFRIVEYGV